MRIVMTVSLVQMGAVLYTPVLAAIAQSLARNGNALAQVLPAAAGIGVILSGGAAEWFCQKGQYRAAILSGGTLFAIGSLCSWQLFFSFYGLLAGALLLGVGIGLVCPAAVGLITASFYGEEKQRAMGLQSVAAYGGAMLLLVTGGYLSAHFPWRMVFLAGLLIVPGLLLTWATPIAAKQSAESIRMDILPEQEQEKENRNRHRLSGILGIVFLISGLAGITTSNLSMLIVAKGLGDSPQASAAGFCVLAGAAIAAAAYGRGQVLLKKYLLAFAFGLLAIGQALCGWGISLPVIAIGSFLAGGALGIAIPYLFLTAADCGKSAGRSNAGAVMIASNLGAVLPPLVTFGLSVIGTSTVSWRYAVSAVLAGWMMAALGLLAWREKGE